jgi:hypothetical protein
VPFVPTRRAYPLTIQSLCDAADARAARRLQAVYDACEVQGALSRIGLDLGYRVSVANLLAAQRPRAVRIA